MHMHTCTPTEKQNLFLMEEASEEKTCSNVLKLSIKFSYVVVCESLRVSVVLAAHCCGALRLSDLFSAFS